MGIGVEVLQVIDRAEAAAEQDLPEAAPLLVVELADLLEPCANLKAAAWVLQGCWTQVGSEPGDFATNGRVHRALSCFNTGHAERGVHNGYVWRVFRSAQTGLRVPPAAKTH